jgi:hypothetical protein
MMSEQVNKLIRLKYVALDSSQLGAIARDKCSKDKARQNRATEFARGLDQSGSILLLSWHHLQELFSHHKADVVAQRVEFVRSLPMVASIASIAGDNIIGSVIDIQAAETRIAFKEPAASVESIRDEASKTLFRLVSGAEAVQPFMQSWTELGPEWARQQERSREIIAISRSGFAAISHVKIFDLLKGTSRTPEGIQQQLQNLHSRLSQDIRERGDKRISDAEWTSALFLGDVNRLGAATLGAENPALTILSLFNIDISEIGPETTVGDVGAIGTFRSKLHVLNQHLALPWQELKARIKEDRLPSGVIQSGVAQFHPDTQERDGSELTDRHLACLSPYANVTYVDKRTHEAFRQARLKLEKFAKVAGRVEKVGEYASVLNLLEVD